MSDETTEPLSAAALTAAVLEEEAARQAAAAEADEVLFAEDLLPGVGADEMPLREGLMKGGPATFVILMLLGGLDELEATAITVLGPDIGETFGISDGLVQFLAASSSSFLILGAIPMGYMADKFKRGPIVAWASIIFGFMVFVTGFAINAFTMFLARFGVGISKANTITVHNSLLSDAYPIEVRGRVFAFKTLAGRSMAVLSPILVGAIASLAGGVEGWRWAFWLLGIPALVFAFLGFRIKEPPRGQWEKQSVLGQDIPDDDPAPIAMEAAFERLWKINTLRNMIVGLIALGFGIFALPSLQSLYLEEEFGLSAWQRGLVISASGVGVFIVIFMGGFFDRLYRKSPESALRLLGFLFIPAAVFVPIQWLMPNAWLFAIMGIPVSALLGSAFALTGPIFQSVSPYRLRGMTTALVTMYLFLFGAVVGSILSGIFTDNIGERNTVLVLVPASLLIGGLLVLRTSRLIRNDLSLVVSELQEEQAEHRRQAENPDDIPVLQVNEVDFAYGQVQVLFDVAFEVQEGEVLALLGTNGAGKSTILNVIAGLGTPQRGVVRLDGRTITYTAPEQRTELGIHMLAGGKGVFPSMTVRQNLVMGAYHYRNDPADVERRITRVLDLFPDLGQRQDQAAGSMSGGQQQQLALARTLLHEPRVLIIDELSLGLAPVVVESLIKIVEDLKAEGLTMIIVEQSLNVALAIADRAVFLEKGRVRFEGDAQELAERDDLARAVFLGAEGG